jgi:hypothetical protein
VVATIENGLRVRRSDGTEIDFVPNSAAASFDVGQARELKVSSGDWLLLQANHGKDFINGERVQVRETRDGRIALTDCRVLPSTFNTFTHGYAVTSHSSQGKTVDDVLLVASSRSFAAVNREQFYVSISRGRERCQIFTDDADLLASRVTASHERQAAVELVALRQELAELGFVRKVPADGHHAHGQQLKEEAAPITVSVRQHRQFRPTRATRLSPVQCLANLVEDVRRWIEEWLSRQRKESVAQTESVKQSERIAPVTKETPGQKLRRVREHQQHQQRRSGGMHV